MNSLAGGEIELKGLTKRFEEALAVDAIDVSIHAGEFFSLLGPSGCGKTTTLRMIAGFERPTSGQIVLDRVDVAQVPPHRRNVHTVFQSYALFPHKNVFDNIAFGLRRRRVPKDEVRRRVAESIELVELSGLDKRRPNQLSGGQQQRVALARALVLRPAVLLLDEPLGALDAKIRKQLRVELKALQEEVGITFVFVTHDQEEALSMSDRIAVMNAGRIEQIGTPAEVYEDPATVFVADFLGVSNLTDAEGVSSDGRECTVRMGEFTLRAGCGDINARGAVKVVARPERVELLPFDARGRDNTMPGMVERTVYVGSTVQVIVRLANGQPIQVAVTNAGTAGDYRQGTAVLVRIAPEALRVLAVPDGGGDGTAGGEHGPAALPVGAARA
ncbi:MAG TPA: ABC transporter ATP-binding protein [Solirubrobacteraceae bacterium]